MLGRFGHLTGAYLNQMPEGAVNREVLQEGNKRRPVQFPTHGKEVDAIDRQERCVYDGGVLLPVKGTDAAVFRCRAQQRKGGAYQFGVRCHTVAKEKEGQILLLLRIAEIFPLYKRQGFQNAVKGCV